MRPEPEHLYAEEFWCEPERVFVAKHGTEVWVHNASDCRSPPSEDIIALAVAEAMDNDDGGIVRVKPRQ